MSIKDYSDLLKKSISEEHIKYYEYLDFKNIQKIGSGSVADVYRANWKNTNRFFALKSFNIISDYFTLKEVVNELKLHRSVDDHENITKLYGITNVEYKYSLVLEYADNGSLNNYLKEHFNELDWNDKYRLALQLASAVEYIHECDIIHCDLNAYNILIHQKNIKLADFGLSKKIAEESSNTSKVLGVIPYIDPKCYNNNGYKLNKKSDVYSVGVLMWQISSGYQPFSDDYDIYLIMAIYEGRREKIIDDTPIEYSDLYTKCWKYEPNERPDMQEVASTLKEISSKQEQEQDNIINDYSLKKYNSNSTLSTMDLNYELNLNYELDINDYNISNIGSLNTAYEGGTSFEPISTAISHKQIDIMTDDIDSFNSNSSIDIYSDLLIDNIPHITVSEDSFESTFNNINNLIINKLINVIIKKHNESYTFNQVQQLINQKILQLNQDTDNLINWLINNQYKPQYTWLLGLLYYYNIGAGKNNTEVFELFSKAADENYSIAQVYLAKCYIDGYGIKQNKNLAFNWYQKAAENKSIIGQFYLGYCYEFGIGVEKDDKKSIEWYQKAANNENTMAILYLANCYRIGKGVEKDEIMAFKYYKILAEKEIADAQHQLGNCFYNGFGTKVDKEQAFYWYKKAILNGNMIAKDILKKYYNKEIKDEINKIKETKTQNILSFKGLSQFGLNYIGTKLTKNNNKKGFNYIQKAAEDGYKVAQFNLGNFYRKGEGVEKDEKKAFELYKQSAEQGYTNAEFQLGGCYDKGIGTDINKVKAFELYKIAAEKGNSDAQNCLGLLYENGQGIEKNLEKAVYWYNKAAKSGNIVAYSNLGNCYEFGKGVEINKSKAFEYYKKSAEKEYNKAQFQLGYCYDKGIGTDINKVKSFELYKIATEKGNSDAQNCLGLLYENGQGIEKDLEKAVYWYNKAAESGNKAAYSNLGNCYEFGKGVEKDKVKASEYYKKSAEKEDIEVQFQLTSKIDFKSSLNSQSKILTELNTKKVHKDFEENYINLTTAFQESINIIDRNQITETKRLNNDHISNISSARLSTINDKIVLKELRCDENNLRLLNKELNNWIKVHEHPNIIEFLGIFQEKQNLFLVIPYARNGNLRNYYKTNEVSINEKMEIALNITNGIKHLHDNDIIHGNLHSNNILIFSNGIAQISDLPLPNSSEKATDFDGHLFDNIGYIDPNSFLNKETDETLKSMDIYSLGSLLWEIMSGKIPYLEDQKVGILKLITKIKNGYREKDVAGIPIDYIKLYKECWDGNSSDRPKIENIYEKLKSIKANFFC